MLTVDGYQFQLKSFNSKKTMKFWRCSNRSCGVILHTNLTNEFVRFSGSFGEHCHLPNPVETEVRGLRESMRKRAETELVPLQKIAEDEVRQKLLSGEALAILPNITNLGTFERFQFIAKTCSVFLLLLSRTLSRIQTTKTDSSDSSIVVISSVRHLPDGLPER